MVAPALIRYGIRYAKGYAARKAASSLVNAAASAAGSMYKKWRNRNKRTLRTTRSRPAVTTQRDVVSTGTRKQSRSLRRFAKRVRLALAAEAPRQIYMAQGKGNTSWAGAAGTQPVQDVRGVYLGDLNTSAQGDLWNIFKDSYSLAAVADAEKYKISLRNMTLDLQIKNTGTEQCYVTVYRIMARQNVDSTADLNSLWQTYFSDMGSVGAVTYDHPGMTPYHVPNFVRYFKIMAKSEFIIKPDESVSLQLRRFVNRTINGRILQDIDGALQGFTCGLLFTVRGVPENTADNSGLTGYNLSWSYQTSYFYQEVPNSQTGDEIGQTK